MSRQPESKPRTRDACVRDALFGLAFTFATLFIMVAYVSPWLDRFTRSPTGFDFTLIVLLGAAIWAVASTVHAFLTFDWSGTETGASKARPTG